LNTDGATLVGVAFCDGAPEDLKELDAQDKYCGFIGRARKGTSFCVPGENISCPLARFHLGIEDPDLPDLARILVGWTDAVDVNTGITFLNNAFRLPGDFSHISFLDFPDPEMTPDVLIAVCSANRAQGIVQRTVARTGKRMRSPISGIGAACGECTACVLTEGSPVVSLGCNGSRPGISLRTGEVLIAALPDSPMGELLRSTK